MTFEERISALTDVGFDVAFLISKQVGGPHDAIAALAIAFARILAEFPEAEWPEVFKQHESMARQCVPAIGTILVRNQ